jgi:hypothetical protein
MVASLSSPTLVPPEGEGSFIDLWCGCDIGFLFFDVGALLLDYKIHLTGIIACCALPLTLHC